MLYYFHHKWQSRRTSEQELIQNSHKIKSGLEIHYDGDLPARSGMGSSSSFSVGLMYALIKYQKKNISNINLAKKTINFEQKIMKETVGSQDQIAASVGGFNKIEFLKNDKIIIKRILSKNLKKLKGELSPRTIKRNISNDNFLKFQWAWTL